MAGKLTCEAVARAWRGEPAKREAGELLYPCPYPERHTNRDAHPSLKINRKKDVWGCFVCKAGGKGGWSLAAFLAGVDASNKPAVKAWLREHGLLAKKPEPAANATKGQGRERLREHVYTNEDGDPLATKIRWGSHDPEEDRRLKHFSWQRWEGGKWLNGLDAYKQGALPLYRIDKIKGLPQGAPVFVCEGEHDADAGADIGLHTTTSGGVGSWGERHTEALRARAVGIVPHADEAGRAEAQKRAASLYGKAARVKIVEMLGYKDLAEAIEAGLTKEDALMLFETEPEWKPPSGAEILDAATGFIRRFVSLSQAQTRAVVLWVCHTFAFPAWDCTAYLHISSPEKQSGKTRLLEVLEKIVMNPWLTGRTTAAALVRKIDGEHPTLLLDESDTAFQQEKEYVAALRGILDSGHRKSGKASLVVGQGAAMEVRDFHTFAAKAIAGIGRLPDTVQDRCLPIRLKRARRGQVERFREREAQREGSEIAARLAAWCAVNLEKLRQARPEIPAQLSDRQADACEPLLAIGDLAGGEWPGSARMALVELCAKAQAQDDSIGVKLLSGVRAIFFPHSDDGEALPGIERIASCDLAKALGELEGQPWAEWGKAEKPITQGQLARLLARYEVAPRTVRLPGGRRLKGYEREQFSEPWELYLPPDSPSVP